MKNLILDLITNHRFPIILMKKKCRVPTSLEKSENLDEGEIEICDPLRKVWKSHIQSWEKLGK
jgi:hypothetical protein